MLYTSMNFTSTGLIVIYRMIHISHLFGHQCSKLLAYHIALSPRMIMRVMYPEYASPIALLHPKQTVSMAFPAALSMLP